MSTLDKLIILDLPQMYVPGKLTDVEKVLVDVGTGYYVEMVSLIIFLSNIPLYCPPQKRGTLKLIRPSVCLSVCHKNFNLPHIFWSINDRTLIFGMHDLCDQPFLLVPAVILTFQALTYLKVKFVAWLGNTILRICLYHIILRQNIIINSSSWFTTVCNCECLKKHVK